MPFRGSRGSLPVVVSGGSSKHPFFELEMPFGHFGGLEIANGFINPELVHASCISLLWMLI